MRSLQAGSSVIFPSTLDWVHMNTSAPTKNQPASPRPVARRRPSLAELSGSAQADRTDRVLEHVLPGDRSKGVEVAAFGSSI